jgi:hypothetical protein
MAWVIKRGEEDVGKMLGPGYSAYLRPLRVQIGGTKIDLPEKYTSDIVVEFEPQYNVLLNRYFLALKECKGSTALQWFLLDSSSAGGLDEDCLVCLQSMDLAEALWGQAPMRLECRKRVFYQDCVTKIEYSSQAKCPICRKPIREALRWRKELTLERIFSIS